jgi:hypothetical protein
VNNSEASDISGVVNNSGVADIIGAVNNSGIVNNSGVADIIGVVNNSGAADNSDVAEISTGNEVSKVKRLVLSNTNAYEPTLPSYKFTPNNNRMPSPPETVRRKTKKNKKENTKENTKENKKENTKENTKENKKENTPRRERLVLSNNNTYEPTLPSYKFTPNNNRATSPPETARRNTKKNKKNNTKENKQENKQESTPIQPRERLVLSNNNTFEPKNPSFNFSSTNSPRSSMNPESVRRSPGHVAENGHTEAYRTPGFEAEVIESPAQTVLADTNTDNVASVTTNTSAKRSIMSNNTARSAFRPEPVRQSKKNKQKSKRITRKA